jgi:hypothetical protein
MEGVDSLPVNRLGVLMDEFKLHGVHPVPGARLELAGDIRRLELAVPGARLKLSGSIRRLELVVPEARRKLAGGANHRNAT